VHAKRPPRNGVHKTIKTIGRVLGGIAVLAIIISALYLMSNQAAPTAPSTLNLTPTTIYVNTELFGSASGSTDADGDTITYYYKFYNQTDGVTRQDYSTDNSYTITTADAHDNIRVFAKAYDNYEYSAENENSIIVSNSSPTAPTRWTDLGMNLTNHTSAVSWTKGTDADNDTVTTYVYVGTTSTPTTEETHNTRTTANLGSTITLSDGVTYYYRLRSWDGYEWSTSYTTSDQFRMNTPPTTPTTLTLNASGSTDAEGDSITYYYKFYNNNDGVIRQDWSTTNTYTIQAADAHDNIRVYAKAYDGYEYSNQFENSKINYYDAARNYVSMNYAPVGEKNIANLVAFLDQIEFRDYEESVFDCSEASSMLEWLLEGAGFSASIASNDSYIFGHTWVLVTLDTGDIVAIEATQLTLNNYAPPGIIEAPDGRFREYTYEYKMFLEWKERYPPDLYAYDPNITFEEWKQQYLMPIFQFGIPSRETYYDPPKIYDSPADAMAGSGYVYTPKSEWDWWNASPYNSMGPFNEWD
jgi:hypothetical protein